MAEMQLGNKNVDLELLNYTGEPIPITNARAGTSKNVELEDLE